MLKIKYKPNPIMYESAHLCIKQNTQLKISAFTALGIHREYLVLYFDQIRKSSEDNTSGCG